MTPPEKSYIAALTMTCGACPTQWEGQTSDGQVVYVRYRHGRLTWGFGTDISAAVKASFDGAQLIVTQEDLGVMDLDEMLRFTGMELAPDAELTHAWQSEYWGEDD